MKKIKDDQPEAKREMIYTDDPLFLPSNRGRRLNAIVWMKSLVFLIVLTSFCSEIYGQIPTVISEFEGYTGIEIPRMSTNEILHISDPVDGLLIYDSTLNHFKYYSVTSGTWRSISVEEQATRSSRALENVQIPHNPSSASDWNVQGNIEADLFSSDPPLLGTSDAFPIVFITNDQERMRLEEDGDIAIVRSLEVGENLTVKQNVDLNTIGGETMNDGPFTVTNQSPTVLTGALTSQKNVDLNSLGGQTINNGPLTVANHSSTSLTGALTVDLKTRLKLGLEVYDSTILHGLFEVDNNYSSLLTGQTTISDLTQSASAAVSTGAIVIGGGVGIGKNLNIGGDFNVAGTSAFGGPVAFASPVTISALEESTSTATGALIVGGGTGIAKRIYVGGATMLESTLGVMDATVLGSTLGVGGNLGVNGTKFTIDALTGNTAVDGILGVKGNLSVNNTKFTVAALTGNTAVDGTVAVKGNLGVDGTKFTVAAPTGNTAIDGTLGVKGNLSVDGTKFTVVASTGNSTVDGALGVKGNLSVDGTKFTVAAPTGNTAVEGSLGVKGNLRVNGTKYTVAASSGNTNIDGSLMVSGSTILNSTLTVKGPTGDQSFYNSYPLKVEGGSQGIAIKVNGSRSNSTNFMSFWDDTKMWGRIEGQQSSELTKDKNYERIKGELDLAVTISSINVFNATLDVSLAAAELTSWLFSSTVCAGLGFCVTGPVTSKIIWSTLKLAAMTANLAAVSHGLNVAEDKRDAYIAQKATTIGVTFQSGAGDYAEWLPKANHSDVFIPGFVVGMKDGRISLNTETADKILAISTNPIVLGNMPSEEHETKYEKVAFMGQVPVHVIGKVSMGDYILPSGKNDGLAKAVNPAKMTADDYIKMVGMAWSASTNDVYNIINVAVGLNDGDISKLAAEQNREIQSLHQKIEEIKREESQTDAVLAQLIPEYKDALALLEEDVIIPNKKTIYQEGRSAEGVIEMTVPDPSNIIYFDITREQILEGIEMTETMFLESGIDLNTHPFWNKMNSEISYKEGVIIEMQKNLQKALLTHKLINKQSAHKR